MDTTCADCDTRAVGVAFNAEVIREDYPEFAAGVPLCGKHRDHKRDAAGDSWEDADFRRFVDQ